MAERIAEQDLRILVASQEDLRAQIRQAFQDKLDDRQLHWVSQADLVLGHALELGPHVVLLDQDLVHAETGALVRHLVNLVPQTAVLVLIAPDRIVAASQAVLAGASGFLVKPFQNRELARVIEQVVNEPRASATMSKKTSRADEGRVVLFCAPKGGTGRTTIALNTAISLRLQTKAPVVLIDADYAAPALDVVLNLKPERDIVDLLPRLGQLDEAMMSDVLATHPSGIKVLSAPSPAALEDGYIPLQAVQQVVAVLKRMFPWVIVDLGLPMDETALAFFDSADRIVMTVIPEMVGLRNMQRMLEHLQSHGHEREKVWLVLNRATLKGGIKVYDIEEQLQVSVQHAVPDNQSLATASINRGVPLVISYRHSAVARAVADLAQQLMADSKPAGALAESDPEPRFGLAQIFRRRQSAGVTS